MNDRSFKLLNLLVRSKGFITIDLLAETLNVSRRSIYNDIDLINTYLHHRYNASITKVYGKGICISDSIKETMRNDIEPDMTHYYEFDKNERQSWIYLYIACIYDTPLFVDDLCSLFRVSRSTVLNDLHDLKHGLSPFNIEINFDIKNGYNLTGNEVEVRNQIIDYYMKINQTELLPLIPEESIQLFQSLITSYEHSIKIKITDEYRNLLNSWFTLFGMRMIQSCYIVLDKEEISVIQSTKEFSAFENICAEQNISKHYPLKKTERIYMTRFMLSAKLKSVQDYYASSDIDSSLETVITAMIDDFEKNAGIFFQERNSLFRNLFYHLKPAYYRLKYDIRIENPLKNEVKEKYKDIFNLTERVSVYFQQFVKKFLTDDEIAFIAIHFGGWLQRNKINIENKKLKIILVCTNGIGIARIMENQMSNLLPEYEIVSVSSISDYNARDDWSDIVDFAVTTNRLKDRGVPIIKVNPLFTKDDKKELLSMGKSEHQFTKEYALKDAESLMQIIAQHADIKHIGQLKEDILKFIKEKNEIHSVDKPSLKSLLTVSHIQILNGIENWESAIRTAAAPLLNDHTITSQYIQKMIEIVKVQGTYMMVTDDIALPHASNLDGVNQTGLSILLLKEPVFMMDRHVRMFIVLASVDNENHIGAITDLTQIFRDKEKVHALMNADNPQQFHTILFSHSTGGIL
ncbi:BglG family transcription antiterminator [Corticicoccus populi]|uniref:BglG family transcription antiterminator n=1 Tax=Corticicoccus populi TaxID=1812821 RepID=A0ABW5WX37_9STAP